MSRLHEVHRKHLEGVRFTRKIKYMVNSTINTKNFTSDDFDFVPMFVFVFDTDSYKLPPSIHTSITKTKNVECEPTFKIIA